MNKSLHLLLSPDVILDANRRNPRFDMQKLRREAMALDPSEDWEVLLVSHDVFPALVKSEGVQTVALRSLASYRSPYDESPRTTPDMHTNSVKFDYGLYPTDEHERCESEGICRCPVIEINGIENISAYALAHELARISNHPENDAFCLALAALVSECIEKNGGVNALDITPNVVGGYYGEELHGAYVGNQLAHEFLDCLHQVEAVPLELLENVLERNSKLATASLELPKSASHSTRGGGRYAIIQDEFDKRYPGLRLLTYPDMRVGHLLFDGSYKIQDRPFVDWVQKRTNAIPSSVELPQFFVKPNDLFREMQEEIKAFHEMSNESTSNALEVS